MMKMASKALLLLMFFHMHETNENLKKLFVWGPGKVEFEWKDQETLKHHLSANKYIPENNVPVGIAKHPFKPMMFVTICRWKSGVASTLNWVPIGTGKLNERLRPYPNWEVNNIYSKESTPYKIIAVIRVFVDVCDRLWVMDNGYDHKLQHRQQLAPAKILIFNLKNDNLIRKFEFNSEIGFPDSSFGKILVDVTRESCKKAFAYITDVRHPGLVVYDYHQNKAFRIEHSYLEKEPLKNFFYIQGKKLESGNNIDGICLSGLYKDGYRNLYVSAQASNKQFVTSTKFLQNESYTKSNDMFYYLGERCSTCQSGGGQVIDENSGAMLYNELYNSALSCWNGNLDNFSPSTQQRIAVSPEFNYISDIIITRDCPQQVIFISCDLNKHFHSNEGVHSRVFAGNLCLLLKDTICEPKCSC